MVNKISNTKVGIVSPITVYENSPEAQDLADQFLKVIPAGVVGSIISSSPNLNDGEGVVDGEGENITTPTDPKPTDPSSPIKKIAPTLADIEVVSNTLVYDAANNPTATVIFKVRNSSGKSVKGIKAKVEAK